MTCSSLLCLFRVLHQQRSDLVSVESSTMAEERKKNKMYGEGRTSNRITVSCLTLSVWRTILAPTRQQKLRLAHCSWLCARVSDKITKCGQVKPCEGMAYSALKDLRLGLFEVVLQSPWLSGLCGLIGCLRHCGTQAVAKRQDTLRG